MRRWLYHLEHIGLWLIILSLLAEATVGFAELKGYISISTEKILSIIFTVMIAVGVWVEWLGDSVIQAAFRKKVAPRELSEDDATRIIGSIKPFGAIRYELNCEPGVERSFEDQLVSILGRAGWRLAGYSRSLMSLPGKAYPDAQYSGVQIRINKSRINDFLNPANALAHALTNAMRVSVGVVGDPPDSPNSCSSDAIHVEVYMKS